MIKSILTILSFMLISGASFSINRYVTNTNNTGLGSLRQVISIAGPTDVIYFDTLLIAGGSDTIKLNSTIQIFRDIHIKGLYNSTDTLYISGQNLHRVFSANSACESMIIDSLFVINGNGIPASEDGGAISFLGVILSITNSNFVGNKAENGGAIHFYARKDFIECTINNTIIKNSVANLGGGGIFFDAIFSKKITIDFINNTVENNSSYGAGGGMILGGDVDNVSMKINNCIFKSNSTTFSNGGALSINWRADIFLAEIIGTKIIDNSSVFNGGGLFIDYNSQSANTNIINSIISRNSAGFDGGGIRFEGNGSSTSKLNIINTTMDSNVSVNTSGGGAFLVHNFKNETIINNSTFSNNKANENGCGIYLRSDEFSSPNILTMNNVTIFNNKRIGYPVTNAKESGLYVASRLGPIVTIKNSTIFQNEKYGVYCSRHYTSAPGSLTLQNSIFHSNTLQSFAGNNLVSQGYNLFEDSTITNSISTDKLGVSSSALSLGSLANNGGPTMTLMPATGSEAINNGSVSDFSDAQNGPVIDARRDIGSCENGAGTYVSLKEKITKNATIIKLYPNPSINYSMIDFGKEYENITLNLFDINGREIAVYEIKNKQSFKLTTSNLIKGVYYVRIRLDNEMKVMKLLKI